MGAGDSHAQQQQQENGEQQHRWGQQQQQCGARHAGSPDPIMHTCTTVTCFESRWPCCPPLVAKAQPDPGNACRAAQIVQGGICQPPTFSTAATFMMWEVLATLTDLACLATVLQLAAGALAVNAIAIGVQSLQVWCGLTGLAVGTAGDEGTALGVGNTLAESVSVLLGAGHTRQRMERRQQGWKISIHLIVTDITNDTAAHVT